MVSCPICNRDFKSSNSMRSHRSRFHDAGPEKDINIQNSSNESDESNDEHVYRYNIDNGTNITNEESRKRWITQSTTDVLISIMMS